MKKRLHTLQSHKKILVVIGILLVCVCGATFSIAKYYASKSSKGVATAAAYYFTSNLLKNKESGADYQEVYNNTPWDGTGTYSFDLQIRNYENQLLYNDENLNIVYDITFELLGEEDGYEYKVGKESASTTVFPAEKTVTFHNISLAGGEMKANHFAVTVTAAGTPKSQFTSRGIKVTATPVSPDYVAGSRLLGGILHATTVAGSYQMSYGFDIEDSLVGEDAWTSTDKTLIDGYSALPWNLTTTGDTESESRSITISWNNTYVEINKFDTNYQNSVDKGDDYMVLDIEPYTSLHITFFKTSSFHCDVITSLTKLHNLVKVVEN